MANFTPPPDFQYDANSGLYYKTVQGFDSVTKKRGQMVTWFFPQTGQQTQEFYPVEEEKVVESTKTTQTPTQKPVRGKRSYSGWIFLALLIGFAVFIYYGFQTGFDGGSMSDIPFIGDKVGGAGYNPHYGTQVEAEFPVDKTGFVPRRFTWDLPEDGRNPENRKLPAGRYITRSGGLVFYIDYGDDPNTFFFELFRKTNDGDKYEIGELPVPKNNKEAVVYKGETQDFEVELGVRGAFNLITGNRLIMEGRPNYYTIYLVKAKYGETPTFRFNNAGEPMNAYNTFMFDMFGSRGGLMMFVPLLIIIGGTFVIYKFILGPYRRYLLNTYGFKLFLNIPGVVVMVSYALASTVGGFISGSATGASEGERILGLLILGAPGMLIYSINCFGKTRSFLITLVNIPLMYFIYFLVGYVLGFLVTAVLFFATLCSSLMHAFTSGIRQSGAQAKWDSMGAGERSEARRTGRLD